MASDWCLPDPQLVQLVTELFEREGTTTGDDHRETHQFPHAMWSKVASLDLPYIGIEIEDGGPGGSFIDLLAVVRIAARYGVDLPLAETNLAAWLLARAGQPLPDGPMAVAPRGLEEAVEIEPGTVIGRLGEVSWGRWADLVVTDLGDLDQGPSLLTVQPNKESIVFGANLAGLPLDTIDVKLGKSAALKLDRSLRGDMLARGALLKVAQIAGAIDGVFDLTRRYASMRVQFGRPISKFDGVRQHLVTLAQMSAMTKLVLQPAAHAYCQRSSGFEVYAAKLVANQNAAAAVRAAHQVHAAIGMTKEYVLHRFTARLRAWPNEFGSHREVAPILGRMASEQSITELVTSVGGTANTVDSLL